ncbi:MAG: TIGR01777 family oxidoreductase [Acidobacteria bacterium]|nr:TIGR01777 family oxidoreductase [Acidobacteriota bacterium]
MPSSSCRVLLSGASGFIAAALVPELQKQGFEVFQLVRGAAREENQIAWDPIQPLSPKQVSGFDTVIHLAGEPIMGRWSGAKKRRIRESRVLGTRHLSDALAEAAERPRVFLAGSAIGYYGDRGDEVLLEESAAGQGFLPDVCREWEAATQAASEAGVRVVHLRTGLVLSSQGGALGRMLTPFRLGVGGNVGNGRQWWSWIDMADQVGAILHILQTESLRGAVNLVAPNSVTNAEFTRTLAGVLHRPAIFPVPAFVVRLVFGEMGKELLLASQRVEPAKLLGSGYRFRYSGLRASLQAALE